MKETVNIKINQLPSKTWHWLKLNETNFAWPDEAQGCTIVKKESTENEALSGGKETAEALADIKAFEAVETGAGRQVDCVFKAVAPERITAAAGREQANPVVYEISGTDTASAGMLDIYAEENSRITVVERFTKKSPEEKNLAFRTRMIAAKNSKIRLVQVIVLGEEQTLLSDTGCVCDENAQVELLQLFIGKGHVYNGVRTDLKGERADFQAQTGYLVQNTQLLDMNYIVNHIGKKTTSNVTADGTLKDAAHKVFRGSIDFKRGASGAKGTENEQVLLLGDDVINQTIPLILCAEEDVEGNHGAAIGELDEETLLYFAARGIDKKHAEDIMTRAKLELLTHKIDDEETKEFAAEQLSEVLADDSL